MQTAAVVAPAASQRFISSTKLFSPPHMASPVILEAFHYFTSDGGNTTLRLLHPSDGHDRGGRFRHSGGNARVYVTVKCRRLHFRLTRRLRLQTCGHLSVNLLVTA